MSKRNTVSYVKPQEPAFLTRLKQEAGFVPKDTVETKKVTLPSCTDDDLDDKDDEQPVVVVLKPGDISAEEAEQIKAEQLQILKRPIGAEEGANGWRPLLLLIGFRGTGGPEPEGGVSRPFQTDAGGRAGRRW
ncbi:uncharacterized protein KIAA1143 homolog isoform X2 [Schistocerca piceifrons]|uniref:uncharacterized protein KIAA1143 homolog isoform X2 n=1 Tax=Schistocerca piceifrons TaxID=274613 RepID=UPI001F5F3AB9|nr:uncharacterized protein KIAA1143 homolog isoform X2 [Schistocerca piceifrons]